MDKDLVSEISYESQINMNILREDEDGKVSILDTSTINLSSYPKDSQKETYLEKNFSVLLGMVLFGTFCICLYCSVLIFNISSKMDIFIISVYTTFI